MKHVRLLSLLIALVVCLFAIPASAEVTTATTTYTVDAEALGLPSNDELFAYYFERQLLAETYGSISTFGTGRASAGSRLTGDAAHLYAILAEQIKDVAANGSTDTIYSFGTTINYDGATLVPDFEYQFTETSPAFITSVMNALIADYPYDLYWFDKGDEGWAQSAYTSGDTIYLLEVRLSVAKAYQNGAQYTVRSASDAVKQVVNTAKSVVEKHNSKTDREKLEAYKDYICTQVDYNHDAVSSSYTGGYGDPWQLIYVFDGDDTTNVVCEGYSKAFQYLCDLSTFTDAECYTVTGTMSGGTGAGAHMWNIVKLNGKNWLVDVTNSDPDKDADGNVSVGYDGSLFLNDPYSGTVNNGYTFKTTDNAYVAYGYDSPNIWGLDVLTLGAVAIVDDIYYQDFSSALKDWSKTGTTLTLLADKSKCAVIEITAGQTKVLNLNGFTLTSKDSYSVFINNFGALTINGTGALVGGSTAACIQNASNGNLTISGDVTISAQRTFDYGSGIIDLSEMTDVEGLTIYASAAQDNMSKFVLPEGYALCDSDDKVLDALTAGATATITTPNATNYVADVNGTKYEVFQEAVIAWQQADGTSTLKLLANVTDFHAGIEKTGRILDLNGFSWQNKTYQNMVLQVKSEGSLLIQDSIGTGKIIRSDSDGAALDVDGKLTITGSVTIDAPIDISIAGTVDLRSATNCEGWVVDNATFDLSTLEGYPLMLYADEWLPAGYALKIGTKIDYELDASATGTIVEHSTCTENDWGYDEEDHWKKCDCGRTLTFGSHTMEGLVNNSDGTHSPACTDGCGYVNETSKSAHTYTASYTDNKDGATHTAACACGATKSENHTIIPATGKCACGAQAVASVTIGSETTYYTTLHAALTAANKQTATVTLLADCTLAEKVELNPVDTGAQTVITLDLNGKTITSTAQLIVKNSTLSLTIQDGGNSGKVDFTSTSGSAAITVNYGTLNIEGGTFTATGSNSAKLFISENSGKINIFGGSFSTAGSSSTPIVLGSDSVVTISGSPTFKAPETRYEFSISGEGKLDVSGVEGNAADGWRVYANGPTVTVGDKLTLPANYKLKLGEGFVTELGAGKTGTIVYHAEHNYTHSYTDSKDGATHTAACTCGATKSENHTIIPSTGKCACGAQAVASVTIGSETTYYTTLYDALTEAKDKTVTVTVLADCELENQRRLNNDDTPFTVTLDLNGKTVTFADKGYLIASANATLVITGNGTINATENEPLSAENNGVLTIENGTFNVTANNATTIAVREGATLNIQGGTFTTTAVSNYTHIYMRGTVNVTGAPTFTGTNNNPEFSINSGKLDLSNATPTAEWRVYANGGEVTVGTNLLLPNSYAVQVTNDDGTTAIVTSLASSTIGTIVEHTEHSYAWVTTDADKHWQECPCGAKKDEGTHSLTRTPIAGKEEHTIGCSVCGYTAANGPHDFTNGACACGATPVAQVDNTKYAYFANAVAAWEVDSAKTMTLLQDVEYGAVINLKHSCDEYCSHELNKVLDLNGKTLTSTVTANHALYHNVPLTIDGTGKFVANQVGHNIIYSNSTSLTLNGGAFTTKSNYALELNYTNTTIDSDNVTLEANLALINVCASSESVLLTITGNGCDGWKIWNNISNEASISIPDGFHLEDKNGNQLAAIDKLPGQQYTVIKADHNHNWSYTADDAADTITATCDAAGCPTSTVVVTLPDTTFTYDGSEKSVVPTYEPENSGLAATVSYTGEQTNVTTNGFTATMTLGTAEVSKQFTISPSSIEGATIDNIDAVTYNTEAQKPEVTVSISMAGSASDQTLALNTDYDVAYENNINVGTATVTVTGQGNYTGTKTATFTINPAQITDSALSVSDCFYTGEALEPEVTVKVFPNVTMVKDTDYTVAYKNNVNAGNATVTVTGKGNYTGIATTNFLIHKSGAIISAKSYLGDVEQTAFTYGDTITITGKVESTGKLPETAQTLSLRTTNNVEMYIGDDTTPIAGATLDENNNFILTCNTAEKNFVPSTNAITLTVKYLGGNMAPQSATVSITLAPKPLTVTGATAASRTYDGTYQIAINTVTLDGILTVNGTTDNVSVNTTELMGTISGTDVGTYTTVTLPEMTLTGDHAAFYTAAGTTVDSTVTISAKAISTPTIVLDPATFVYDGTAKEPAVTVKDGETVIPATEYTVSYQNNTDVGTEAAKPTVVIADNDGGNYTVSGTKEFAITQSPSVVTATADKPNGYTYGDTITITGQAAVDTTAQTFALRARVNTAALYYADIKLAEYTMTDNTFTLTYDTAGKDLLIGESTLTVEFGGNGNLAGTTATVTVKLNKADPKADTPTDLKATYGQTLADVPLPKGWAWNNDTTTPVGDAGTQTFKATYTSPVDADYYNTVVTDVNVEVERLAITGVTAPGDQALNVYCPTVEDIIAQLPKTLPGTGADGNSYNVPVEWSFTGEEFNDDPEAENPFTWKALPGDNFTIPDTATGSITVKNGKALPVTITGTDTAITYNGSTFDVSTLFTIDANAGAATYSIVSNGTDAGAGTLGVDGKTLTITKSGTITIKVTTAAHTVNGTPYAAGEATAVLTVSKGTPAYTVPTGLSATYGDTLADVTLPEGWAWKEDVTTKVGDAGERIHKATFTPTATDLWNTVEADVTITVAKAAIPLEGVAATYLDTVAKTVFTYGQTITVKATPAMPMTMALSFDEPEPNQMALFYGDTQISAPADAVDGTYTMTYQTTGKVLPIGDSKIRVKYVGTTNISDGTFDLTVTLEKANLTVSSVTLKNRAYEPGNSQVEVTAATLSGIIGSDEVLADTAKMRCILKANGEMTDKVGEYTEVILPAEIPLTGAHAAYYTAEGGTAIAATVSITKATPVANGTPDFENVTPGTALKDVPTDAIEELYKPVEGTVTWTEPDATVEPGKEYEYTFTPKDTENYESVTGTAVIIPVAPPQPVVPPVVLPTVTVPTEAQLVTVCEGETADMSVTAINATAYQWYINRNDGLGWRPIIGADAPAYTTSPTTLDADGFLYLCRVSNADGAVNSPVFTLDVVPALDVPPTGDNTPVMLLAAMLFLSAAGLVIMASKKRSFN